MCHPSWEKNICVVHVFVLFSVETIRLHVFDSPADLQNMLHDEMSLVDDQTDYLLEKYEELSCLAPKSQSNDKERAWADTTAVPYYK